MSAALPDPVSIPKGAPAPAGGAVAGGPPGSSAELYPGAVVGRYTLGDVLGEGGMGVVYKAHDEQLDRDAALKFLPSHLSRDADARERLKLEARAASALDHPNICTIYEVGETARGRVYIAMACYDGEPLSHRIRSGGPLALDTALDLAGQIACGLAAAHERGIVHRDVKPSNVVVTRTGVAKLLDFGIAKVAGVELTRTGTTLGTAAYMAPEQSRGRADARSDVWSLGVVLFEMVTGRRPFASEYEGALLFDVLYTEPEFDALARAGASEAVVAVVQRCLAKDPGARFDCMEDLRLALEAVRKGEPVPGGTACAASPLLALPHAPAAADVAPAAVRRTARRASAPPSDERLAVRRASLVGRRPPPRRRATAGVLLAAVALVAVAVAAFALTARTGAPGIVLSGGAQAAGGGAGADGAGAETDVVAETHTPGSVPGAPGEPAAALPLPSADPAPPTVAYAAPQPAPRAMPRAAPQPAPQPAPRPVPAEVLPPEVRAAPPSAQGTLTVHVHPAGSAVVGGRRVAGGSALALSAGTHAVTCESPRYGAMTARAVVPAGGGAALACHFEAEVRVGARRADGGGPAPFAAVWVNGQNTGAFTPTTLTLGPGSHRISLRREGYASPDGEQTVTVEPSLQPHSHSLSFRLERTL